MDTLLHLRAVPLFSGLTDTDLALVEPLVERVCYDVGAVVCRQGAVVDALYIVDGGELQVLNVDTRGVERPIDSIQPGQFFGEMALLLGEVQNTAVTVKTEAVLLIIHREDFKRLLKEHRDLSRRLRARLPLERTKRISQMQFPWLMPNEVAMLVTHKHWWALVRALPGLVELVFLLVCVAIIFTALSQASFLTIFAWAIAVLFAIVGSVYAVIDWHIDLYIITNRRVVHLERFLLLRTELQEAPIEQIQNVEVRQPTLFEKIIGMGDVVIATAARNGGIVFAQLANANEVCEKVFEQTQRTRALQKYEEREQLKKELRAKIRDTSPLTTTTVTPATRQPTRPSSRPLKSFISDLFAMRIERGGTITWRKHWTALGKQVWRPISFSLLSLLVMLMLNLSGILLSFPFLYLVLGALQFALFGWAVWEWVDWRNDIYMVTINRVVDVEKNPLGIIKKSVQAPLINITNVSYKQPNWLAVALNVGNVMIETAGGAGGQMIFLSMYQPGQVTNEILQRVENVREQPWKEQREQQHPSFLQWFGAYDSILQDEKVIPRPSIPPVTTPDAQSPPDLKPSA